MRRRLPMRDGLIAALALVVSLAAMPAGVSGQETAAETLVTGRRSITFGVFSGGSGSFGIWKMRDERTNLGVLLDLGFLSSHSNLEGDDNDVTLTQISAGVGPEVRRYADFSGRVAPYGFLGGRLGATYRKQALEPALEEERWQADLSGLIGLGVEFFPVPNLAIAAQTGLLAQIGYAPLDTPTGERTDVIFRLSTFGASLGGSIYF